MSETKQEGWWRTDARWERLPRKDYGRGLLNPTPYDPKCCMQQIITADRAAMFYQCQRKVWREGFCKQHHPDTVVEREAQAWAKYKAREEAQPWNQLGRLEKRLHALVEEWRNTDLPFNGAEDDLWPVPLHLEGCTYREARSWLDDPGEECTCSTEHKLLAWVNHRVMLLGKVRLVLRERTNALDAILRGEEK